MRSSNQRTARVLGLLGGLCVLGGASAAHAQLVAPFSDRIDVDQQYVMGATGATDIAWAADGRAVVTTKNGTIIVRQTSGMSIQRAGVFSNVSMAGEQGLLGVVADPMVANTFYFYVSNGDAADRHRVMKAVLNADNTFTVDATPVIAASRMLGPGLAGPANHNGGGLSIYQNRLYVGVGDTGANATPPTNKFSSCLNRPNGKVLRVALDGTIPTDNPLANVAMATACDSTGGAWATAAPDRRVFAWGFRNPWRVWVDPMSGLLWVGDVGETTREEVSVGRGDSHFGYPFREGTTTYDGQNGRGADGSLQNMHCMTMSPARACTGPVHDWARVNGAAAVGGLIPDGCGWNTALGGTMYLFSDYGPGFLRGLTVSNRMMGTASSTATNLGTFNSGPVSFRMGPDESLYIVMNRGNSVIRLTPRDRTGCMGGMGGAGGGGPGGAGNPGGAAGAGTMGGAGGVPAGAGGVGMDMGGQAGSIAPGGTASGGAAGVGTPTGGASGAVATGGAAPGGGVGANGGAPVGGAPGGGSGNRDEIEEPAGCGCRAARGSGFGYLALALGLVLTLGARLRRGRRKGD